MAGAPEESSDQGDLVAEHGARLHHLAAVLTGATDGATRLTAQTLAAAAPGAGWRELRAALVRAYLRTAPRRPERMLPGGVQDAGDVLERLRPRERAVASLRLVEGASTADTAEALRLPADKVARLLPTTPGLGTALQAVGDRYALHGSDLAAALEPAVAQAPSEPPGRDRRRWWWVAAAAVPLAAVIGGYALSPDREETDGPDEAAPTGAETVDVGSVDLTGAGFELGEDGEAPRGAAGLTRMTTVELVAGRTADLTLRTYDARFGGPAASFAVLWCDMPPADDPALDRPVGEISVDGSQLTVPCAGTAGEPAVGLDHLVALPASGEAQVRVTGDLPPDGGAVLGIYAQTDDMVVEPLPDGDLTAGPPVPPDAVVVDEPGPPLPLDQGGRLAQPVELSPGSTVRVWAGRTGAVTVLVDGTPVTDDGDLARWSGGRADWRDQQPDVREGRWMVYVPGSAREFTLPADLVPEGDEPRSAVVEVLAESTDHVQVVVTRAVPGDADRTPVPQADGDEAPELVSGHRRAGAWDLPMDGLERELLDPPQGPDIAWALVGADPDDRRGPWSFFGGGLLRAGQTVLPVWLTEDPSEVIDPFQGSWMRQGWVETSDGRLTEADQPAAGSPLLASAPATPGHRSGLLVAYEPVPYEDFDVAAAQVPAGTRPAGEEPSESSFLSGPPMATVTGADLDAAGRTTVEVPTGVFGARITTEGRGRIRFQVDGEPVELLNGTDGWWSSWTDRDVVSETLLTYGAYSTTGDRELSITVQDYEDVRIELLRP